MKSFAWAALTALPLLATGAELSSGMKIVVPDRECKGVNAAIREAGVRLSKALKEGAGLDVPVVAAGQFAGGRAVFLGAAAAKRAGLSAEGLKVFDNVIAERDGNVYVYGNDRAGDTSREWCAWANCVLPTVRGVCRFMETRMDCRFVMPGEVGTDVPKVAKVTVPDGAFDIERPWLEADMARADEMMNDIANNNFGSCAYKSFGGHTWAYAFPVEKYFKDHPEWYALRCGKRAGIRGNPSICFSNPEVEDKLVEFMVRTFDAGYDVVELGQNDGVEYCQCEKCAAVGLGKGIGEAILRFHRRVAERLNALRPEKRVLILAYSVTQPPPKTFSEFPANTMVELCHPSEKLFDAWKSVKVPQGFSVYLYEWGSYPMPGLTAKRSFARLAKLARLLHALPAKAIYRCGYGECFGTEGASYYVFNRLLADPSQDVNVLVDDFCRRAFGPAAKQMQNFYRTLDRRLAAHDALESARALPSSPADLLAYIYTPSVMETLAGSLAAAEKAGAGDRKIALRLRLVRQEYEYAKLLGRICHFANAYRLHPTAEFFAPLADAVEARNRMIDGFYDEKGYLKRWPEWPELRPFGYGRKAKGELMLNGSLGAVLTSPFGWDVKTLRENGVLPGASRKEMKVPKAAAKPTLADFKAGTGDWTRCAWQDLGGMQMEKVATKTRFKALYDDENLYVAVETDLPDDQTFVPRGHDGVCFRFQDIEAMIDPTGCHERYYHLVWNPVQDSDYDAATGLIEDPLDPKYGQEDVSWDGNWTTQDDRADNVWRTLLTLPFKTVGAQTPAKGEVWTMNIGRSTGYQAGSGFAERSLWNPNLESISFTAPEAYGKVMFD